MKTGSNIFNYIDAERKILGFSLFEITTTAVTCIMGFAFKAMLVAVVGMFGSVFVIRYAKYLLKESGFLRRVYFNASDLNYRKKAGNNAKFYL